MKKIKRTHIPAHAKRLDGLEAAGFIQERHARQAAGFLARPTLAIVRSTTNEAAERYLRVKKQYGADIDVDVQAYAEAPDTLLDRIHQLNEDPDITGIIVQLPLPSAELTTQALAAVHPDKDVDGLGPNSPFEATTPKAVLWLLASYNIDLTGRIVVVGQGRLVGKPLADRLEASGADVVRCDIHTPDLAAETRQAHIIVTGTGHPELITSDMVGEGAILVDTGAPTRELNPELFDRGDLKITPNPGGIGPMTVAALFDNLLIAAGRQL